MKHLFWLPVLGLFLVAPFTAVQGSVHFGLSRSSPEADATVEPPAEIRLWFTEEPQEGTTAIHLVGAEEAGVHVTEPAQDPDDPRSFSLALHGELAPGQYTVSWRGMGSDGHVVRDSFQFTVAAP